MANLNDRDISNRDHAPVNPDVPNSYVTATNETNMREGTTPRQAAYRDGYVHGQDTQQRRDELNQEIRDNDTAARGLLLGILLTGAVGLATAAYFLSQRPDPVPTRETIVVPRSSPVPQAPPSPQVQERVIERERVVPVPQPVAPAAPSSSVPGVTNTAPQSVPQTEPVAPVAPAAPAAGQSTTPTPIDPAAPTGAPPEGTTSPAPTTTSPQTQSPGNPASNP